jgi:hypothetical protein
MIQDTLEAKVTSTMGTSDAKQMGIDQKSLRFIISSLTDIYQDGVLACIREYSANARDSHETAGQTRPIQVTLPSAFNPNFVVKDYGTGMNAEELDMYCRHYGASSKRESNDVIGFFGLGFKCALTVVPQFSIVSIKDGVKYHATITRGEDTIGVFDIISTIRTDEPNGFEVTIPAGKASEFLARSEEFFMTWKPGTVLINGKEPKSFDSESFEKVGEFGYIANSRHTNSHNSSFTVVMGGIGYKLAMSWDLRKEMFGSRERTFGYGQIVLNVPLGDVELVPNREALKLTDKTKTNVKKHLGILLDEFSKQVNSKIANAATRMDALREIENFGFAFSRSETKWKGEVIPSQVSTLATLYSYSNGRRGKYSSGKAALAITSMSKKNATIFVETGSASGDNSLALRHIASYAKSKDFTLAKVYMGTLGDEINPWIQEMIDAEFVHLVKIEDMISAAKTYNKENRTVRAASGPRDTLTYHVGLVKSGVAYFESLTVAELDSLTGPVYYIHEDRGCGNIRGRAFDDYSRLNTIKAALRILGDDSKIILVASNRKVSSLEARLKTITVSDAVPALKKKLEAALKRDFSASNRLSYYVRTIGSYSVTTAIRTLAKGGALDPVFGVMNTALDSTDSELQTAIADAKSLLSWDNDTINALFSKKAELSGEDIYRNLFTHFPLMRIFANSMNNCTTAETAAFIEHFNAVFEAKGAFTV